MLKGLLSLLLALCGCGVFPETVELSDPEVTALLSARSRVDTSSLGFTPIEHADSVRLERSSGAYDRMLHIEGTTSRTVSFRAIAGGWRWIGEQEIHTGPRTFDHADGKLNESITITYELEPVTGYPLNTINVTYWGDDSRLQRRPLTLEDVRPALAEWEGQRAHGVGAGRQ
jgi:hypothetical protein